jgi:hypothetical protein
VNLPDLLFGVATSDHQAEAYDGNLPDFRDEWEKQQGRVAVFPRCSLDPYDSDMGASLAP